MPSAKAISHIKTGHNKSPLQCPNYTHSHSPGHNNCPACNAICKGCSKKVTGMQSATALAMPANIPLSLMELRRPPVVDAHGKGKKADMVQDSTKETPPCNELLINMINCGPIGDTHPEEILVDDVHAPWCNEAHTMVQLPASTSSKGTASLHVKVNTGAGGNMLPLHVFQHLYPSQISPDGLPTGLHHISTRLTAYNGSHIPLYGTLPGPIIWQPGSPGAQPCKVKSYWYVADTKVSGCQDELCHHSYPTQHKTSKPCICFHSNSSQAYCSPCSSQAHQIH